MTDTDDVSASGKSSLERIPWWRILNLVKLLLVLVVVLPMLVYTAPQVVGADQSYVVLSGSMEPTMSPGDVIIVDSVEASEIEQGDIITYGGTPPTTHRVIEVTEEGGTPAFRTQGDANEDPDSQLVTPAQLNGKVMSVGGQPFVIPYVGYLIQFASTQIGFVIFVALPVVLFVVSEIWDLVSAESTDSDSGDAEASGESTTDPADDGHSAGSSTMDSDESETSGEEMTFTRTELELGLIAFGGFAAYSIWVLYNTQETWSFGVAGSVTAAFLLLVALYVTGIGLDDAPTGQAAGEQTPTDSSGTVSKPSGGTVSKPSGGTVSKPSGGTVSAEDPSQALRSSLQEKLTDIHESVARGGEADTAGAAGEHVSAANGGTAIHDSQSPARSGSGERSENGSGGARAELTILDGTVAHEDDATITAGETHD